MKLIDILLGSRPWVILGLCCASAYTTFTGLNLYLPWWPISLILTIAVQVLVVIGTLQLTMARRQASLRRFLGIAFCLFLSMGVSVFFSYFAFYQQYESENLQLQRFATVSGGVDAFLREIQDLRTKLVSQQQQSIRQQRDKAEAEALGANGQVGKGKKYDTLYDEVKRRETELAELSNEDEVEAHVNELRVFVANTNPSKLLSENEYQHFMDLVASIRKSVDRFTKKQGVPPVNPPNIIRWEEYREKRPAFSDLAHISPVAASLAVLVDLFAVFLTFWLESVPFGRLTQKERKLVVESILQFSDWKINENNQLDFRLSRTEAERSSGINDGPRTFWASSLLSRGLLKRVDPSRAEFAPRLYKVFIDYFSDEDPR